MSALTLLSLSLSQLPNSAGQSRQPREASGATPPRPPPAGASRVVRRSLVAVAAENEAPTDQWGGGVVVWCGLVLWFGFGVFFVCGLVRCGLVVWWIFSMT